MMTENEEKLIEALNDMFWLIKMVTEDQTMPFDEYATVKRARKTIADVEKG